MAAAPRGGVGALTRGLAELADELAAATSVAELREANRRAAALLGADDLALLQIDGDQLVLVTDDNCHERGAAWPLADFPATGHVIADRVPGQLVTGDPTGDPAELAALAETGNAALLMVPVAFGDRTLAVMELYRALPVAFTTREIDLARVLAQQYGAAIDRLSA
jgi:GAF domain-containing protein